MPAPNLPVTESVKFVESLWLQLGFLGLFIFALLVIIWFLHSQNGKWEKRYSKQREGHAIERDLKQRSHQEEWVRLKKEHHDDRKVWFEISEKRLDMIMVTMKENSTKFTNLIESTVKDNNKLLAEVSTVIKGCQNNFN